MDAVTAAAMWQEANVSKRLQRIVLRYLASQFGRRLIVPQIEIDTLGQNFVEPHFSLFVLEKKKDTLLDKVSVKGDGDFIEVEIR